MSVSKLLARLAETAAEAYVEYNIIQRACYGAKYDRRVAFEAHHVAELETQLADAKGYDDTEAQAEEAKALEAYEDAQTVYDEAEMTRTEALKWYQFIGDLEERVSSYQ